MHSQFRSTWFICNLWLAILPAKLRCNCFSWNFCTSSKDLTFSRCQALTHMKLAHAHCTQHPTQWPQTAPDTTDSADLEPLTACKFGQLGSFAHFWRLYCQQKQLRAALRGALGSRNMTLHSHFAETWPIWSLRTHTLHPICDPMAQSCPCSTDSTDLQSLKHANSINLVHLSISDQSSMCLLGFGWVLSENQTRGQNLQKWKIGPSRFRATSIHFEENQIFWFFGVKVLLEIKPRFRGKSIYFEENQRISWKWKRGWLSTKTWKKVNRWKTRPNKRKTSKNWRFLSAISSQHKTLENKAQTQKVHRKKRTGQRNNVTK